MIFVTVGTQDKPFKRIIEQVENYVKDGKIIDKVIVQAGNTNYSSNYLKILNYVPYDEFEAYIKEADLIITHGGVGSILNSLKYGKKIIAVPRLKKYAEHINDHQLQVIKKMTDSGYILSCIDEKDLLYRIIEAKNFVPKKYISNKEEFITKFKKILDETIE